MVDDMVGAGKQEMVFLKVATLISASHLKFT